ncbi:DUF917 domain-containing protein [Halobaculum sp. EA56]|uniref:DUF917 domain-containing protein n=1 Tax=Halobaculum sp. EA56 TaxID=3421648 RepID=UPI003EBF4967
MRVGTDELADIALGATVLGTGGGGDPHVGRLVAEQAIEDCGPVEMVHPGEVDDDELVLVSAQMGAPTVAVEKLPGGHEPVTSVERVEKELGRTADYAMPMECGGINSTFPFAVAARKGIPLVDADGMGRAFPELQHETFNVYGVDGTPAAVGDEHGNTTLLETDTNERLEWLARGITIRMGGVAYVTDYPMSGREVNDTAIHGTMSLAMDIGRAIRTADSDPVAAIRSATANSIYGDARTLFEGKIVDVRRRTEGGFVVGTVEIDGLGPDDGTEMTIEFQNENLGARVRAAGSDDPGEWVATVPDLITVLDRETGDPVRTEALRYGARVQVLGIPTPEIMRTDAALDVWGPETFGLDTQFVPLAR